MIFGDTVSCRDIRWDQTSQTWSHLTWFSSISCIKIVVAISWCGCTWVELNSPSRNSDLKLWSTSSLLLIPSRVFLSLSVLPFLLRFFNLRHSLKLGISIASLSLDYSLMCGRLLVELRPWALSFLTQFIPTRLAFRLIIIIGVWCMTFLLIFSFLINIPLFLIVFNFTSIYLLPIFDFVNCVRWH